jgi:DNA-binding transcriptional LysR family regulator
VDWVRHLTYFLTLAEEGHVGAAADRLEIAQPALSQRLRRLEAELGARLFDRTSRGMVLTPAGEALRAEAPGLLARFDAVRREVALAARGEAGTFRLGVPAQAPGAALAAALAALAATRPGLRVELHDVPTPGQRLRLADGRLDAGLAIVAGGADSGGDGPRLVVGRVVEVALGVVVARTSPLAARTELTLADLAGHDVVLPGDDPELRDGTLAACRSGGLAPRSVREAAQPEIALALVAAGEGVALDGGAIARKEPRVAWRPLTGTAPAWRLAVVWPADRSHPAAPAVAHAIAEALAEAVGAGGSGSGQADGSRVAGDAGDARPPSRHGPWAVVNAGFDAGLHAQATDAGP